MTAQDIFPKINGDILYASEVNRFNPKFIGEVVGPITGNISGNGVYTLISSITYLAGSTQIYSYLNVRAETYHDDTLTKYFRLRISGTAGLNMATAAKSSLGGGISVVNFDHIYTSGAITASGGNIGSPYVLSLEGYSSSAGINYNGGDFTVVGW